MLQSQHATRRLRWRGREVCAEFTRGRSFARREYCPCVKFLINTGFKGQVVHSNGTVAQTIAARAAAVVLGGRCFPFRFALVLLSRFCLSRLAALTGTSVSVLDAILDSDGMSLAPEGAGY